MIKIEDILMREEGQTFDRKSFLIKPKDLAVTLVAMANADGGDVVVGISDRKREIEGVDGDEQKLNDIRRTPFDFCVPSISVSTDMVPCVDRSGKDNHVLVFHVEPGLRVYANQADEVFLRVGDKSKKLSFDERFQLMNDKGQACYEETGVLSAGMDDIDMPLVEDYCKTIGYGKTADDFLKENHGYLVEKNGALHPTVASMLLFGKRTQDFLPRAYVRLIHYDGVEEKVGSEMNVIKDITFVGTVRRQIDKAVEYLATQIIERTYLGSKGLFITETEYPEFVRQELIVNACCHRDYSIAGTDIQIKLFDDRLVIESPGNLPGLVRPDNIRTTHFSRNPRIAHYLKAYGYVKEFGEGVDRMCREMEAGGLRPIRYYKKDFILQAVAFSKYAESSGKLGKSSGKLGKSSGKLGKSSGNLPISWAEIKGKCNVNTLAILDYLAVHGEITNAIAREVTGLSSPGVRKILTNLADNKIVKGKGTFRNKSYILLAHFVD